MARLRVSLTIVFVITTFSALSANAETTNSILNWGAISTTTAPPGREFAAMSYDLGHGRTVLFGGDQFIYNPGTSVPPYLGDTWEWDGTSWTNVTPSLSPPPLSGASIAFDSVRARVVLFGGHNSSSGRLNDTWEWDGTNWTQRNSNAVPFPRWGAAMVFDSNVGKTILFGGDHLRPLALGSVNDTWAWDGNQWIRVWTDAAPIGRIGHSMAYDSARNRSVVLGGTNVVSPQVYYTDTWESGTDTPTQTGRPALMFS